VIGALLQKELKALLLSPKFSATFAVCSLLILLSVYIGVRDYQARVTQYDITTTLADQQAREAQSWHGFSYKTVRKPDPMEIFVSGLTNDIGRWSQVDAATSIKLKHSGYSDDPIFAFFRFIDFTFIVQIVLSLFAILFTYDAVNGERERGTLKLIFANSVSRAQYLVAKCTGALLGLVVPILIPIILSLLLVQVMGVSLTGELMMRFGALIVISMLYFVLFIIIGLFISSLTRHSSLSFLVSLVLWIAFILIIPRAGVMAANHLVDVPRVAEIEGKRDGFAKDRWGTFYKGMEERFRSQREANDGNDPDDVEMWQEMQFQDSARKNVEREIQEFESSLLSDLRQRKSMQEQLAFRLSRLSPASSYQLSAMSLAGTNVNLKTRSESSMSEYRQRLNDYVDNKAETSGSQGGFISIEVSSETGLSINSGRDKGELDLSDMPRYQSPKLSLSEMIAPVIPDVGLLGLGLILSFLGAYIAFLRYDVR